jgi:hypothetical protein
MTQELTKKSTTTDALAQYVPYTAEAAQEDEQEAQSDGGYFKFPQGITYLRFLPPLQTWGRKSPWVNTHGHFIEIPGQKKPVAFNCPRLMVKSACPACAFAERLRASKSPVDQKRADDLKPRFRAFANAVVIGQENKGPQIIGVGTTIYKALAGIRQDSRGGGDYTDPTDSGFEIIIDKTGEKLDTKYEIRPARESTPLGDMGWLMMQKDPINNAIVLEADEIEELLETAMGASAAVARTSATTSGRTVGGAPSVSRGGRSSRSAADDMDGGHK